MVRKLCKVSILETGEKICVTAQDFLEFIEIVSEVTKTVTGNLKIETPDGFSLNAEGFQICFDDSDKPEFHVKFTDPLPNAVENPIIHNGESVNEGSQAGATLANDPPECRFDVKDVIRNSGLPEQKIDALFNSLENSTTLRSPDRRQLNKILGTYLYSNFGSDVNPPPCILNEMAQSITTHFPVAADVGNSSNSWYNPKTGNGRLIKYVGRKRRQNGVKRPYTRREAQQDIVPHESEAAETFMRASSLTENNRAAMMQAHNNSFIVRRAWIVKEKPALSAIINRFPRFQDCLDSIKADFASVCKVDLDSFLPKWLEVEPKVICLFPNEKKEAIESCECQAEKSQLIFMALPSLLPNGLRRSIKTLPTEESIRNKFLQVFPDRFTIERAVAESSMSGMDEPGILVIGKQFFLKCESVSIELKVGCLAEAVAYLSGIYFVFNCNYPSVLRNLFGFFEHLIGIPLTRKSVQSNVTVIDFLTKLSRQ